jgi:TonB family protein
LYRCSQNQNYFVVLLVAFFHALFLLCMLFLDMQKRVTVDFGLVTGSILVDLHQIKPSTQIKHASAGVTEHTPEISNGQNLADINSGSTHKSIGFDAMTAEKFSPAKIDGPKPHYPISSRRLREEGQVMVRLCIDSAGEVEKAHIQQSSGYPSLDHSALIALSKWRFSASSKSLDTSFEGCFRFPVRFTLES